MKLFLTDEKLRELNVEAIRHFREELASARAVEPYTSEIDNAREGCKVAFNLSSNEIELLGIQRVNVGTVNEKTFVGYYFKKELVECEDFEKLKIREWYFECSRAEHDRLVEQWKKVLQTKTPTSTGKRLIKG